MDKRLLDDLQNRRNAALMGGGAEKLEERRKSGLLTARDRVSSLFDPGTFQETGLHVRHRATEFGMDKRDAAADAVVTGWGHVDGRLTGVVSQDFTVLGGTLGELHAKKACEVMEHAIHLGMPVVTFNDSGGARIQEGVHSLSGYGLVFFKNVELSGLVPQIAVIAGPCAGGAAYSPALCDFIIMVRKRSHMFICGPEVIKASTGVAVTMEEIGAAEAHAEVSGNAHFIAESDQEAVDLVKRLLGYLPPNNLVDPPHDLSGSAPTTRDAELAGLVPERSNAPFDVREVIRRIADPGSFLEVHAGFAKNIVVGFTRIGGVVAGIVANNPAVKAGTIDIDSSDKGARFIRFCDCFNIPIVTLVDTPGFLPGVQQEKGGIIRHGAKMLFSYASATVPKITVIMRKAYGGAYLAMCSRDIGADAVFAWPTAEVAVMGADQAVRILYRKELADAKDAEARAKEFADEYRRKFASPYQAAGVGMLTDVIDPAETRMVLAHSIRNFLGKRATRPPKKHGNMPL